MEQYEPGPEGPRRSPRLRSTPVHRPWADIRQKSCDPRQKRRGSHFPLKWGRSAADSEDLAAAVGADALSRRLAVLHRDALGVLDLDLLLVLDAVSLGHCKKPPGDERGVPRTLMVVPARASVPDGDELESLSTHRCR